MLWLRRTLLLVAVLTQLEGCLGLIGVVADSHRDYHKWKVGDQVSFIDPISVKRVSTYIDRETGLEKPIIIVEISLRGDFKLSNGIRLDPSRHDSTLELVKTREELETEAAIE